MGRLFSALICGLMVVVPASAQVKLEWKWKEGDTFYVKTTRLIKQKVTIRDPGGDPKKSRDVTLESEITTVLRYKVAKKESNGVVTLSQEIESLVVRSPGGNVSRPDAVAPETKLTLTLAPNGEVTKVEGYRGLIQRLADKQSDRDVIEKVLTEETLKQAANEIFAILPAQPVKQGATWPRSTAYQLGPLGKLSLKRTFTFEGEEKSASKTVSKMSFNTEATQFASNRRPGEAWFEINPDQLKQCEGKGTLLFDAENGRLVQVDLTSRIKGTMQMMIDTRLHPSTLEQQETITVRVSTTPPG